MIELFENEAPQSVANFITLVKKGFYDGVTFHRVLPCSWRRAAIPDGTGSGGPGYTIPDEQQAAQGAAAFPRQPEHGQHGPAQLGRLAVLPHVRADVVSRRPAHGLRPRDRGDGRGRVAQAARPRGPRRRSRRRTRSSRPKSSATAGTSTSSRSSRSSGGFGPPIADRSVNGRVFPAVFSGLTVATAAPILVSRFSILLVGLYWES